MLSEFFKGAPSIAKTKLMKLFFYSDMISYKFFGKSISGLKYAHLPFGPVPDQYELLLDFLNRYSVLRISITPSDNGYERQDFHFSGKKIEDYLSEEEKTIIKSVTGKFRNLNSTEISEYSHEENGYRHTVVGELISYSYAKDIQWEKVFE